MNVKKNKSIVLCFDGLDPKLLRIALKKGYMPNFKKLIDSGFFSELKTTIPPQSPVAWASFISGSSPSEHGIFDFITRDPSTYLLKLAFSDIGSKKKDDFLDHMWGKKLKYKKIISLFMPNTFEPPRLSGSKIISGMGVPDIFGTQGTYTLFTSRDYRIDLSYRGKIVKLSKSNKMKTFIEGPEYFVGGKKRVSRIPLSFYIKKKSLEIEVDKIKKEVSRGGFSNWIPISFDIGGSKKVGGLVKFYLKSIFPDLEIHMSPISFDPVSPVKSISYPREFASQIVKRVGLFSTLGLPHDSWALEENIFDENIFLKQASDILLERSRIYYSTLDEFKEGIIFAYFGTPDTISHMFWRFLNTNNKYKNVIYDFYGKMDSIVGNTLKKMDKKTKIYILSDHGFAPFKYEININSWLCENNFLALKKGKKESGPLYENVDWSKTLAYGVGYNSIFFNIKNRERNGSLDSKKIVQLEKDLINKLMKFRYSNIDQKVFKKIYTRKDLGIRSNDLRAPDLVIGFYAGIRTSWDSAIGSVSNYIIRKRDSKWGGDHLFDQTEVPGVIISSEQVDDKDLTMDRVINSIIK
ncbi:MAG TPA: alkaline phosphatase family protein [Patescibacteria group bacterium]|nr:alkaline phosphatase family protein [Patescibacteria group bacterium]